MVTVASAAPLSSTSCTEVALAVDHAALAACPSVLTVGLRVKVVMVGGATGRTVKVRDSFARSLSATKVYSVCAAGVGRETWPRVARVTSPGSEAQMGNEPTRTSTAVALMVRQLSVNELPVVPAVGALNTSMTGATPTEVSRTRAGVKSVPAAATTEKRSGRPSVTSMPLGSFSGST
jgi:hypothetical protein